MQFKLMSCSVLAALLLAACVSRQAEYQKAVTGYVGGSIDDVVTDLGPPDSSFQLADGRTIHEWEELSIEHRPRLMQSFSNRYYVETDSGQVVPLGPSILHEGVDEITRICTTRFTVGPDRQVQEVTFEGDGCGV
jgi:hypothetical protein